MIVINCPVCSERYEVNNALAGKKSRCKVCDELFRIPVLTTVRPAESIGPERGRPATPRKDDDDSSGGGRLRFEPSRQQPERSVWDPSFDDESNWQKLPAPKPALADDPDFDPSERPEPKWAFHQKVADRDPRNLDQDDKDAEWSRKVGRQYLMLTLPVVLLAALYASAFGTKHKVLVGLGSFYLVFMMIIGVVLAVTSQFWSIAKAFHESPTQGMLYLFVPAYSQYFTFTRWRRARGPFLLRAYVVVTFLTSIVIVAAFMAAFGKRANPVALAGDPLRPAVKAAGDPATPAQFGNPVPANDARASGDRAARGFAVAGGRAKASRIEAQRQRTELRDQFGDRCVRIQIVGLPTDYDPKQGVTPEDVAADLSRRFQPIMAGAGRTKMTVTLGKAELLLAPVDDPPALAARIDFGTVTVKGSRIEVRLDPSYIASVPRVTPRAAVVRPDVPAPAGPASDPATRSGSS